LTRINLKARIKLVNRRFGSLVVREYAEYKHSEGHWLCDCDCGFTIVVRSSALKHGRITNCGCASRKMRILRAQNIEPRSYSTKPKGPKKVYWLVPSAIDTNRIEYSLLDDIQAWGTFLQEEIEALERGEVVRQTVFGDPCAFVIDTNQKSAFKKLGGCARIY
jgi:hypothetical protein